MNFQNQEDDEESGLPVWARREAFPLAGSGWGWEDRKGKRYDCASLVELEKVIREDDGGKVKLVWTPDSEYFRIPEEVEALAGAISVVRKKWAVEDLADTQHRIKMLGGGLAFLLMYMSYQGWVALERFQSANGVSMTFWQEGKWILKVLIESTTVGLSLLAFLVFAFIPWYQALKKSKEVRMSKGNVEALIPTLRFETWLENQKAPVTKVIMVLITLVFVAQMIVDRAILGFSDSVTDAGLVKSAYREGEYWRVLTAPMLHGGVVHFVMNALALLYLGKRMEVFARWPHVPAVFLFAAVMGGEATARFTELPSVGASGGLMGWLGFLLVFETLHSRLVPRSSRRRLLGGLLMTGLIGLIGYRFIDNAAHLGGLVAGVIYAGIVFPKSASVVRPATNLTDRVVGVVALTLIVLSACLAIFLVFG